MIIVFISSAKQTQTIHQELKVSIINSQHIIIISNMLLTLMVVLRVSCVLVIVLIIFFVFFFSLYVVKECFLSVVRYVGPAPVEYTARDKHKDKKEFS